MLVVDSNNNVIIWGSDPDILKKYELCIAEPEDITEQDEVMYEDVLRNTSWYGKLRLVNSGLRFAHLGNGITVYDVHRYDEEVNDYKTIAHIDVDRKITWRVDTKSIDKSEYSIIVQYANTENPTVSITQNEYVFNELGTDKSINYAKKSK